MGRFRQFSLGALIIIAIFLGVWLVFHRSLPSPVTVYDRMAGLDQTRVNAARIEAQRIASKPWKLDDMVTDDSFNMTLTLRQPHDGETIVLRVNPDHLHWYRYTVIQEEAPGAVIRFEYYGHSLNEAGAFRPQQEYMHEYYLSPLATSLGEGKSFLERRFGSLIKRPPCGPGRSFFLV